MPDGNEADRCQGVVHKMRTMSTMLSATALTLSMRTDCVSVRHWMVPDFSRTRAKHPLLGRTSEDHPRSAEMTATTSAKAVHCGLDACAGRKRGPGSGSLVRVL